MQKKLLLTMKMMCRTDGSFPQFHQRFHPRHSLLYFIYCYLTHLPSTAFLLYNVSCKAPHNSRSIQGKSARLPERFFRLRISYCTAPSSAPADRWDFLDDVSDFHQSSRTRKQMCLGSPHADRSREPESHKNPRCPKAYQLPPEKETAPRR